MKVLLTPEYGLLDEVNQLRGSMNGMDYIYAPQLGDLDLEAQAPRLDVPVYLLEGRFDHNANAVLVKRWFDGLHAPYKELIWFEHSSHSPMISEMERFNQVLAETVLTETVLAESMPK